MRMARFSLDGVLVLLLLQGTALAAGTGTGSVAIMSFETRGVSGALAPVINEAVVQEVRSSHAFEKVASQKDVEVLVGVEVMKQFNNCDSNNCMAELAGALNADYVIVGSISRVGASLVLNARLLAVKTSRLLSSVQRRVGAESEDAALDAVRPAIAQLLTEAGLTHDLKAVASGTPVAPTAPVQGATTASPAALPEESSHPIPRAVFYGIAAGGALPAVLGLFVWVGFGVAASIAGILLSTGAEAIVASSGRIKINRGDIIGIGGWAVGFAPFALGALLGAAVCATALIAARVL